MFDPPVVSPNTAPAPIGAPMAAPAATAVALYIDADNQSCQSAPALVELLRDGFGARIDCATVAGNADGKVNAGWAEALRVQIPGLAVETIVVPCRKEAADAALILALGTHIAEHRRTGTRVVVVSRDALLLAAAERVKASGCSVCVAYADGEVQTARHPTLATLLLPVPAARAAVATAVCPSTPAVGSLAPAPARVPMTRYVAPPTATTASVVVPEAKPSTARLIEQVRAQCKRQPGGGYTATEVGQALRKLGYNSQAERMRIVEGFPGLKKQGQGPYKVLVF